MRYKALPASVRFSRPPAPGPSTDHGSRPDAPIRRGITGLVSAALVAAILLPISAAQAGTAVLSVFPASTLPGTSVTVRGAGFAPHTRGSVGLDVPTGIGVAYRADGAGLFQVRFTVPGTTSPGAHLLVATAQEKRGGSATRLASVALVVATPESPTPSSTVAATQSVSPSVSVKPSATPSAASPTPAPSSGSTPIAAGTPQATNSPTPISWQPRLPIRAAFYYPWFPEGWNQQGMDPFTHYTPSLGFYDGSSDTVIRSQIRAMQYGNIAAGIASWWGVGTRTDQRIPLLLKAAAGTSFRWSLYYEPEGTGNPSVAQIRADLAYIAAHYGTDPSYLHINGRFVVFVYGDATDSCATADRWRLANTVGAYVVLKVFAGYRQCASQPDGWHQYGPAAATDSQPGFSFAVSPGFFKANESSPRLGRDINRWYTDVQQMVASGDPFQLITTFNEWGEGTSVESATEWRSASGFGLYLDALHINGVR